MAKLLTDTELKAIGNACDCENHAHFCKENPRCSHKLAAETYIVMRRIKIE